ncbi:uncharacterized protein LACBIDRAFT_318893 [Laccaria bicolor S238N-H82]|uniref:Predicted protein n=1 Tax=Laccaria bicolor (strain S238N-H82 / ATCC MYA-4686) TaxID=486041 RepID=B0D7D0_LACBS|nr:uncharacterized protein LACBIDRAFT_318893 [Laccaria bicolor S238N-H82]EDR09630.1 predicted protein [Laccaria bicolor S238N-H82]|eukprot:XP_001879979.1 predicted protein [Laccaria bicolor S238N-H82]
MASNALGPSMQSAHSLGPRVSLDDGVSSFTIGECILIRIPGGIQVEEYVEDEVTAVGTNLPPISEGTGSQHLAFICNITVHPLNDSFILDVYPVLAFSHTDGAVATYNNMRNPISKAALIPLSLFSSRHPTPHGFGQPLTLGNWITVNDSFLHVLPRRFTMPMSRSFKRFEPPLMMHARLQLRLHRYRAFLSTANPEDLDVQSHHPFLNGESGEDLPHDQTGHGGGQATSLPTVIGDGNGEGGKLTEEGLADVLEDVDEDAEDGDATLLDDLRLLAASHPMWEEELQRYLQAEQKEREWIQNQRAARLALWREDVAVELSS